MKMSERDFKKLAKTHRLRGKSYEGCQRVLVGELSIYAAAVEVDLSRSVICRALARLRRPLCDTCEQPLPTKRRKS